MKQLILASQSPRRSEILEKAGYQFTSLPVHVSEIPDKNLNLDEQIIEIARRKSKACSLLSQAQGPDTIILAADTMVCLENLPLGKPDNEKVAAEYLRKLSGRVHLVKTALVLINWQSQLEVTHIETTQVTFKNISEKEINDYILSGEPMDKAGAYAIQGRGRNFVEKFEGDYDNVVGLPLHALENLFKLNKWVFHRLQVVP